MGGTRAEKEVYFEKLKALVETYREYPSLPSMCSH
jgi:hypothetical protein